MYAYFHITIITYALPSSIGSYLCDDNKDKEKYYLSELGVVYYVYGRFVYNMFQSRNHLQVIHVSKLLRRANGL